MSCWTLQVLPSANIVDWILGASEVRELALGFSILEYCSQLLVFVCVIENRSL